MTIRVELADDPDLSGWTELTEVNRLTLRCGGIANKTEIGSAGGFDWYDDAGNRSIPGRRPIRVIETATTPDTTLFYGRVSTKGLGRGVVVTEDSKVLGVGMDDRNADLRGIIVDGWVRPAETDVVRVNALITAYLSGSGSTSPRARNSTDLANTYVASSPAIDLPAQTYTDSSPAQVLSDIVTATGKECFVTVDGELFYDAPTSTAYASTYDITDVLPLAADELEPIWEGDAATEDPSELLSGARAKYGVNAAVVSDSRAGIEAAFDKWEDTVFLETSSAAKAALQLDTLLDNQGIEEKSRRCTVMVERDQVHRIKWGQTISFRAAASGDLTPVTLRISYLLWEVPTSPEAPYLAHLELSKPKKIAPRIKKGSSPANVGTSKAPIDPGNLVGLDLGTETWADREYKTLVPHRYAPSSPFTDSDNPLIAQPTAVRGWSTTGPPWIGSGTSGTFVRHVAPAGASWARLRASVYSAGDIIDTTTVAVRLASGASFWDTGTPPQHDQIGNTVWQRTIPTDISPAVTGPFALECIIPIVNGQCQFVFIDVGDVSDPTPPDRSWISYMFAQGEAYGGPLKYELTYYGVSNVGVGDWVQPVTIGIGDGNETIFTTPYPYTPGSLVVYVEGTKQVAEETDPDTGSFTLPYAPAGATAGSLAAVVSAAFVVASLTQTGVPQDPPARELGPVPGTSIQDVGSANAAGTSRDYASEDHVHEGVHAVNTLEGDVVLAAGTNMVITPAGNTLTFDASGGGGGATAWVDLGADAVQLDTGRQIIYDQNADANIVLDAGISLISVGADIELTPDAGQVVDIDSGDGLLLPELAADPTAVRDGHTYYNSVADEVRVRANGAWVGLGSGAHPDLATHDALGLATDTELTAHTTDATDAHDASAISVLDTGGNFTGTDVEAVLAELDAAIAGGGIPATIVDVKGDLIAATAADTVARLAAGTDGFVLTADAAETTGLKWAAGTGGGAVTSIQSGTGALTTNEGEIGWQSATELVRIYDGQRERNVSVVGWAPFAYPIVFSPTSTFGTAVALPAVGGSVAIPILVPSHMLLERLRIRNTDSTLARSYEWRLYAQRLNDGNGAENTLDEIAGANGTESYTATVASVRASVAVSAPVYIGPGQYWLVFRNTHASNTWGLATGAVATQFAPNAYQSQTLGSALGSTLDFVTGWSKATAMVAVRLDGRVFGQTTFF